MAKVDQAARSAAQGWGRTASWEQRSRAAPGLASPRPPAPQAGGSALYRSCLLSAPIMTPPPINQSVQCIAMGTPRKNRKKIPGHPEPTLRVGIILATGHSHPPKPPVLGRPPSGRSRFIGYAHIFCPHQKHFSPAPPAGKESYWYISSGRNLLSGRFRLPGARCFQQSIAPVADSRSATFAEVPCKKARPVRAAGAAWRCVRRTAPGSRSPTP
jgi:hypothetical protein